MFYEEIEYDIAASTLKPSVWALYKGIYGEDLSELVTNLASTAAFEYRVSGSWQSSVSGASLQSIDAIRVHADGFAPSSGSSGTDATFELTIDVPVRGG